jgi:hypothetical protein
VPACCIAFAVASAEQSRQVKKIIVKTKTFLAASLKKFILPIQIFDANGIHL